MEIVDVLLNVAGAFLMIILILLVGLWIYHRRKLQAEAQRFPPPGKMVQVNGTKMHVFTCGTGKKTLIFMAGHGTSGPVLDFKPLWSHLTGDYRIAVIERKGYGWSEASHSPRDLDTVLAETRLALHEAGLESPYVLVPHSMAGLEAIKWAQKYPKEVEAIIGLDPLIPESALAMPEPPRLFLHIMQMIARLGITRLIPAADLPKNLPVMAADELPPEDKEAVQAIFYKSAFTQDMIQEVAYLKENGESVGIQGVLSVPTHFFISTAQESELAGWQQYLTEFLDRSPQSKKTVLDAGHYLHHAKGKIIAETMKSYLDSLRASSNISRDGKP